MLMCDSNYKKSVIETIATCVCIHYTTPSKGNKITARAKFNAIEN